MNTRLQSLGLICFIASFPVAHAQSPSETLSSLKHQAALSGGPSEFSATRGEQFFKATHANDWSCATCHTQNPAAQGKHTRTGKILLPLSPNTNPERFTDQAKVDKWFKRNCKDVLDRECTALEKGDVLTYLMSLK